MYLSLVLNGEDDTSDRRLQRQTQLHYMIKKMRNNTQCHLVAAANPLNHKYLFECDAVVCVRNASDTVMGQAYVAFETHHKFVKTL